MMKSLFRLMSLCVALLWPAIAHSSISLVKKEADGFRYILVEGDFEADYDIDGFKQTVRSFRPSVISFNSPGGNVSSAMSIGRAIREFGLDTIQLRSLECASACAFAFMGGVTRFAEPGSIGVHQSSLSGMKLDPDIAVAATQFGTARDLEYLIEMGVDPALLKLSLSYTSEDIRYLSASEMAALRVTTVGGESGASVETRAEPQVRKPIKSEPEQLAAIEPQIRVADRIAVYQGLDFYGSDMSSITVGSAGSCARECLEKGGLCRAFTYNTSERAKTGPNCFLKSDMGSLQDTNQEAISGILLPPSAPDPQPFSISAIDPTTDLLKGVDIPGSDLGRSNARNLNACRMDCLQNNQCRAFTFVVSKDQCWLKRSGEGAVYRAGMVSAYKRYRRINADEIVTAQ